MVTVEVQHRKELWNRIELEYGYNKVIISIHKIEGKDHLQLYRNSFPGYPENEAYESLVKYYVNATVERQKRKAAEIAVKTKKAEREFWGK